MKIRLSGSQRKKIADQLLSDIEAASVKRFEEEPRSHLGASIIGEDCNRKLVYIFRWMYRETFSGTMFRLFNRGHGEEKRFVQWLVDIGCKVFGADPNEGQIRIASDGHSGGSLDGVCLLPASYLLDVPFLVEMKTHNQNSFSKLQKYGVKSSKKKHYAQMCVYGEDKNLDYGIYFAVNKNTDQLYIEIVEIDKAYGAKLREKMRVIIHAPKLPPKIAASEVYNECKFCSMCPVCHLGKPVHVNCRSCINSEPISGGTWYCKLYQATIPKEAIPLACGQWIPFR